MFGFPDVEASDVAGAFFEADFLDEKLSIVAAVVDGVTSSLFDDVRVERPLAVDVFPPREEFLRKNPKTDSDLETLFDDDDVIADSDLTEPRSPEFDDVKLPTLVRSVAPPVAANEPRRLRPLTVPPYMFECDVIA